MCVYLLVPSYANSRQSVAYARYSFTLKNTQIKLLRLLYASSGHECVCSLLTFSYHRCPCILSHAQPISWESIVTWSWICAESKKQQRLRQQYSTEEWARLILLAISGTRLKEKTRRKFSFSPLSSLASTMCVNWISFSNQLVTYKLMLVKENICMFSQLFSPHNICTSVKCVHVSRTGHMVFAFHFIIEPSAERGTLSFLSVSIFLAGAEIRENL